MLVFFFGMLTIILTEEERDGRFLFFLPFGCLVAVSVLCLFLSSGLVCSF